MTTTATPIHLDGGRFDCPLCQTRFGSVGDKKRHIRDTHPKETR